MASPGKPNAGSIQKEISAATRVKKSNHKKNPKQKKFDHADLEKWLEIHCQVLTNQQNWHNRLMEIALEAIEAREKRVAEAEARKRAEELRAELEAESAKREGSSGEEIKTFEELMVRIRKMEKQAIEAKAAAAVRGESVEEEYY
ncbi:hypothetical protein LOZ12_004108 [Ophidiomyces ophidiicola]|uniref:Uncharacterized protein n=1 Tax=Ophidiomyces ophidiicola TaxID=1387563 RepID=A0ACB8UUF0_9EURO|nr:hypothetical protein LOZ64_006284 [Ophidiomyces ophidiicola]KAI1944350.1 hypothetical protein LOZ62_004222 [Ophidiomyces ophidiicola]KAI1973392.1 hypothetical protein LOZ56_001830 [Ophidiomyces ophidiicola]KAI2004510.1 hypothetical protein LOZ50_004219 [Ophidiomyces ophidiicola]KAI2019640.1 hypothetical protein LOZ46_003281 [Ophidiomyces ophidiicola]